METVWDKLQRNAYRNPDPYPHSPSRPIPVFTMSNAHAKELRDHANSLEAWERDSQAVKELQDAWNQRNCQLTDQFREDLEKETNMAGHPKAELLYYKAWDRGHAYGVDGVYSAYMDMIELVE